MRAPRLKDRSRFDDGQASFLLNGFTLVAVIDVAPGVGPGPSNSENLLVKTGQLGRQQGGKLLVALR